MRKSDFFSGFILGGIIGFVAVILYAPDSGENFRAQIKNYAANIQVEVKNAAITRRSEMEQELALLRNPVKPTEG